MVAVKCCVRKSTNLSLSRQAVNRTREARALCGFQHHKGDILSSFLFSDPIMVGLRCDSDQL